MNYNKMFMMFWMIGDTKLDLIATNEANINSIGFYVVMEKKRT